MGMSKALIIHICGPEVFQHPLKVGKRTYFMDYHDYMGPTFFFRNGECYFPSQHAPIWKAFEKWERKHKGWKP